MTDIAVSDKFRTKKGTAKVGVSSFYLIKKGAVRLARFLKSLPTKDVQFRLSSK